LVEKDDIKIGDFLQIEKPARVRLVKIEGGKENEFLYQWTVSRKGKTLRDRDGGRVIVVAEDCVIINHAINVSGRIQKEALAITRPNLINFKKVGKAVVF
jgi:hypothetical protein